jgi:phosphatidate cytidylyltransferase
LKDIDLLRWRLISAAVILAILLSLVALDMRRAVFGVAGVWLLPVLLASSLLASEELLGLLKAKNHRPAAWPVYLGNLLIPLAAASPVLLDLAGHSFPTNDALGRLGAPLLALAGSSVLVLVAEMWRYERPGVSTVNAALGIFALVYVGLLSSFFALLRLLPTASPPAPSSSPPVDWGIAALVSLLLIVKTADVGAYAIGRLLGRYKMTPRLSPGKTWEGAAGGLATACLVSWAFFRFAAQALVGQSYQEPPLLAALGYGLAIGVAGMIGDLAESLLKRDMERKDSSTWLPGLGGVLDIVDSVLVAGPVAYVFWVFGFVGPGL